ncbi:MAG TPA: beta-propeller domain-containing protein, partial [Acidimicrobiales bacterium]
GPRLAFVYPADGSDAARAQATKTNREVIQTSTLDDWLPSYRPSTGGASKPAYDCARTYTPPVFSGFGLLSVLTLDPGNPKIGDATAIVASGQTVYASPDRLYVATTRWAGTSGGGGIVPDGASLPAGSSAPDGSTSTLIHTFDISGKGPAGYLVSGEVRGHLLNQFSMSDDEGDLRVATTDDTADLAAAPGASSESFVTVLADDGARLAQIGQVGGLGRGEQIQAVRFVGDRAYVVTFRQTDPLYVVDLSDPTAPGVTGELQMLGYSAYLHPLDGDLLIGIGQDADLQGHVHDDTSMYGVQVALFDVSDPAHPKRLQERTIAQTTSEVGQDHHAFLYWPATGLTVVPVQGGSASGGAVGLHVTPTAIDEIGVVRQPMTPAAGGPVLQPPIERSLVIGEHLVTYSTAGLLSSDLATLQGGTWVPFG